MTFLYYNYPFIKNNVRTNKHKQQQTYIWWPLKPTPSVVKENRTIKNLHLTTLKRLLFFYGNIRRHKQPKILITTSVNNAGQEAHTKIHLTNLQKDTVIFCNINVTREDRPSNQKPFRLLRFFENLKICILNWLFIK